MERINHSTVFLRTFWLAASVMFLAVGIFNALVDPFRIFGTPRIPGFNQVKSELDNHIRMVKAISVRLRQPQGVILGTSRADVGIDPDHPGWNVQSHQVYNLALSNGRMDEMLSYLRHAQAHGPLKQVVLSLDLFMFNENWRHEKGFDLHRLSNTENSNLDIGWLRDPAMALFSLDGLKASISTIMEQKKIKADSHFINGARNTSQKWEFIREKGGHRRVFLNNTRHELIQPNGWPLFSLGKNKDPFSTLASFNNLAAFCNKNQIDLRVFISPLHASKLEVIWQLGLGEEIEYWKKSLVEIMSRTETEFWDFSGYNSITIEPFPALDDNTTRMKNYWEGNHYNRKVGNMILDRIFSYQDQDRSIPDDFGVFLTEDNIDIHLNVLRKDRANYLMTHPDDIQEIEKLVRETEAKRDQVLKSKNAVKMM